MTINQFIHTFLIVSLYKQDSADSTDGMVELVIVLQAVLYVIRSEIGSQCCRRGVPILAWCSENKVCKSFFVLSASVD